MPIANSDFFKKETIEKNSRIASPELAELAVHSLELVAELVKENLNFRFKGGNSLLVLLEEPKRFSIDADISTDETKEKIDACLENAVKKYGVFTKWQRRQHKTKPWLPMVSYEIFFNSVITNKESFVMLDAVLHNSKYKTVKRKVVCKDLYQSDAVCEVPSVGSLLGDKILTLGPKTLGIPLGKGKEAQRLKHVHDVALLFTKEPHLDEIRESVKLCIEQENEIQQTSISLKQVLEDTISFCKLPVSFSKQPKEDGGNEYLKEIIKGMETFADFLLSNKYSWGQLQLDTSVVALCLVAVFDNKISNSMFKEVVEYKNDNYDEKVKYLWNKIFEWTGKDYLKEK